ncbi:hypothetical protein H1R20_g13650, partial [Candolleomyces eurysporus]
MFVPPRPPLTQSLTPIILQSGGGNAKTAAIQAQIDDTVGIMRENITKVAERGERLDSLQDKTEYVVEGHEGMHPAASFVGWPMILMLVCPFSLASLFAKMRIIIGVAIAVIIVIIVVSIVKATQK